MQWLCWTLNIKYMLLLMFLMYLFSELLKFYPMVDAIILNALSMGLNISVILSFRLEAVSLTTFHLCLFYSLTIFYDKAWNPLFMMISAWAAGLMTFFATVPKTLPTVFKMFPTYSMFSTISWVSSPSQIKFIFCLRLVFS